MGLQRVEVSVIRQTSLELRASVKTPMLGSSRLNENSPNKHKLPWCLRPRGSCSIGAAIRSGPVGIVRPSPFKLKLPRLRLRFCRHHRHAAISTRQAREMEIERPDSHAFNTSRLRGVFELHIWPCGSLCCHCNITARPDASFDC